MVGAALWVVMSRYSRSSMEEHPDNSRAAEMARQARDRCFISTQPFFGGRFYIPSSWPISMTSIWGWFRAAPTGQ